MAMVVDDEFAAIVAGHLETIEERLYTAAVAENPFVTQAATHVVAAGGKRFRPALVVAAAYCGDRVDAEQLVRAALVVELTHVASLYHDDVMDEADMRRGVSSANAAYGNSVAILVGDYLFARASSEVALLGVDYVRLQAQTFAELVQGQIAETIGAGPDDDPVEHYLGVVAGKTASLIRTSAVFGGMVGGAPPEVLEALASFGFEIGMAFQLSDDLIDVISDDTGKTPGTDLREGIPTLPTLLLRASGDPEDRRLVELIDGGLDRDEDLAIVLSGLRASAVIGQVRETIVGRADTARAYLDALPDGPAKRALQRRCDDVVTRLS
ncbi:polyprenyl synthetase family protein [Brooklawnia cerclae]|uniref:Heptaprenyl diphosphate synthase n=1 Tax=Brooklawnia cerclae TaxID=349934 RepID=A0ABX0SER1_9ACTN|nr:heptaprenyl diphosphate synthase [Brooklawnia cerclae]